MKKVIRCIAALTLCFTSAPCFAVPWQLDSTFGTGGVATTNFATNVDDQIEAMAIDGSGRIVAAGWSGVFFNTDISLARYNANGTIDATFGTGGMIQTAVSGGDNAYAVAIDGSGRILAAGRVAGSISTSDFGVVRYNTDGSVDTSFDGDGVVQTDLGSTDIAYAIAIDGTGNIVVAGTRGNGTASDPALARYTATGALDTTFGTGGLVTTAVANGQQIRGMEIDSVGRIVIAGYEGNSFFLARYDSTGTLDATFGSGGMVTAAGGRAEAMAIDGSDRIVLAGFTPGTNTYVLARFDANGTLDTTFGTNGVVTTDAPSATDIFYAVTIDDSNRIVAAGINGADFSLARYNPDGSLDPTFNTDGLFTTDITGTGQQDHAYAVAADSNAVILAGRAFAANYDFAVARLIPTIVQYVVTATAAGDGTGTVTSDTGGINYSYPADNTGTTSAIDSGTTVTLSATADPGSTAAWTTCSGTVAGNDTGTATCTYASLDGNKNAEATFTLSSYSYVVTATATGNGSGTVTSDSGGINYAYPANNTGTTSAINSGTDVTLTAKATPGATAAWTTCSGIASGNDSGTATCTFPGLDSNKNAEATFTLIPFSWLVRIPGLVSPNKVKGTGQ